MIFTLLEIRRCTSRLARACVWSKTFVPRSAFPHNYWCPADVNTKHTGASNKRRHRFVIIKFYINSLLQFLLNYNAYDYL